MDNPSLWFPLWEPGAYSSGRTHPYSCSCKAHHCYGCRTQFGSWGFRRLFLPCDTSHLIYFDVSAIRPIFRKGRASARKVFLSGSKGSVRYPSYPTRAILPGLDGWKVISPIRRREFGVYHRRCRRIDILCRRIIHYTYLGK